MPLSPAPVAPDLPDSVRYGWFPRHEGPAEDCARDWLATQLGCEPLAVPLIRDALDRPRLSAQFRQFDVNWSHSGEGLLVGLGENLRIGVDIERLRPRPRARALAERFFAPAEAQWLASLPQEECESAFLRLWCAKEAVLKAHGRGLAFGLDKLAFADVDDALSLAACDRLLGVPDDWQLCEFSPAADYHAAIAWRTRAP